MLSISMAIHGFEPFLSLQERNLYNYSETPWFFPETNLFGTK